MKNLKVWAATLLVLFLVAGCETQCEKKRPLNPTEKAWIESHPDGTKRSKPEDFEEFAIKDRCDPTLSVPWQWKKTRTAEDPNKDLPENMKPKLDNQPPIAIMTMTLLEGTRFEFSGLKSYDADGDVLKFQWLIDWLPVSEEPKFEITLERGKEYHVVLNVWYMNEGDRSGNSYKMGSSVDYNLVVDKVTCPDE